MVWRSVYSARFNVRRTDDNCNIRAIDAAPHEWSESSRHPDRRPGDMDIP